MAHLAESIDLSSPSRAYLGTPRTNTNMPERSNDGLTTPRRDVSYRSSRGFKSGLNGQNYEDLILQKQYEISEMHQKRREEQAKQIEELNEALQNLTDENEQLRSDFAHNLEILRLKDQEIARLEALDRERIELHEKLQDANFKADQQKQNFDTATREANAKSDEIKNLKNQHEEHIASLHSAHEAAVASVKHEITETHNKEWEQQKNLHEHELQKHHDKHTERIEHVGKLEKEIGNLQSSKAELLKEKELVHSKFVEIQNKNTKYELQVEQHMKDISRLQSALDEKHAKMEEITTEIENTKQEHEKHVAKIHEDNHGTYSELVQEARAKSDLQQQEHRHKEAMLQAEHRAEIAKYETRISTLQADCDRRVAAMEADTSMKLRELGDLHREAMDRHKDELARCEQQAHARQAKLLMENESERSMKEQRLGEAQEWKDRYMQFEEHVGPALKRDVNRYKEQAENLQKELSQRKVEVEEARGEVLKLKHHNDISHTRREMALEAELGHAKVQIERLQFELDSMSKRRAAAPAPSPSTHRDPPKPVSDPSLEVSHRLRVLESRNVELEHSLQEAIGRVSEARKVKDSEVARLKDTLSNPEELRDMRHALREKTQQVQMLQGTVEQLRDTNARIQDQHIQDREALISLTSDLPQVPTRQSTPQPHSSTINPSNDSASINQSPAPMSTTPQRGLTAREKLNAVRQNLGGSINTSTSARPPWGLDSRNQQRMLEVAKKPWIPAGNVSPRFEPM